MKVYVLAHTYQCDCGDFGTEVEVFETIEKATEVFKELMKQARIDFKYLETEENNYADGDMFWSIWEKEEYAYNHIDLMIFEKEVK